MGTPFYNELMFGYYIDYDFSYQKIKQANGIKIKDEDDFKFFLRQICADNEIGFSIVGKKKDGYIVVGKCIDEENDEMLGHTWKPTKLEDIRMVTEEKKEIVLRAKEEIERFFNRKLPDPKHYLIHHVRDYN